MAQIIEKITTVEFDDGVSRQEYFENHKHQFDFAQFKTLENKYYTITWYDLKDKELDWCERVNRIADLCSMNGYNSITGEKIKKPTPLGTETVGGIFK